MNITVTFVDAVVGGVGAAAIGGIIALARAGFKLAREVSVLVASNKEQTSTLRAIASTIPPMLRAHQASLEAHRDGKCNGNVKDALESVDQAETDFRGFLLEKVG